MAEERPFLARWSARKRAARGREPVLEPPSEAASAPAPPAAAPAEGEAAEPAIDPADLPPLESIKSGGDVQAFLQSGVPKALRQAALRRLWVADPRIRDFKELADYDWDFNAPGYGALLPGDDPKLAATKLLKTIRERLAEPAPTPPPGPPLETAAAADAGDAAPPQPAAITRAPEPTAAATAERPEPPMAARRRRHGTAMPG